MKSIFLIALVFLVTNWPTPSASWSLNQKYADSANTYAQQQQGYDSPLGSSKLMNNGFRLNPELFLSNDDRRAFSRTVGSGNGRSRKLSSTRFNLKPIERVVVDDDDEEFIAEQEQQFEAPQQKQFVIPQQQEVQQKEQKTEALTSMTQLAQESAKRLGEQKQEAAKEAIKETVKETVKEAAIKQEAKQDVKQDIKEEIKQEVKQDAKEEIKQDVVAATAEIIKEKAAVAEESEKVESIKPLNYKAPIQRQQQQQQLRPIMSSQWQQKQQQQQQQPDQLRFQIAQADNVNTVDLNFVKNEAIRTLNYRNGLNPVPLSYGGGAKYNQQPSFYPKEAIRRPENNYNSEREQPRYDDREQYDNDRDRDNSVGDLAKSIGNNVGGLAKEIEKDAKKVMKGFDTIKGTFSSLIIIANSNANSNLGVTAIDVDLLKSFLSTYFLGKQVDYVLKDEDLAKLVEKFNAEHLKKSYSSSGDKKYGGQYEATSKLSANIPVFSNEHEKAAASKADEKADVKSSSSILENTVIVKKEDESVNLNYRGGYRPNVNPIPGGGGYYYLPSPKGSIIVINNLNKNLNERVRAVLSGKDHNLSEYNAGMILPLNEKQINTLMSDAIIVNNDNNNKNLV